MYLLLFAVSTLGVLAAFDKTATLWPTNIPYGIDTELYTDHEIEIIHTGIQWWEDNTCLTFNYMTPDDLVALEVQYLCNYVTPYDLVTLEQQYVYLYVTKRPDYQGGYNEKECSTDSTGLMNNDFGDNIFLGSSCMIRSVAHEIGHVLGLFHEHQRFDRDQYVAITSKNYESSFHFNVAAIKEHGDDIGLPYDIGSIMHYRMNPVKPHDSRMIKTMGQRSQLSFNDAKLINTAYCSDVCKGVNLQCENGGYPDPRDCSRCICRDLFSGALCQNTTSSGSPSCEPLSGMLPVLMDDRTVCMNTPNYMSDGTGFFEQGDECTWFIQVPDGCSSQIWIEQGDPYLQSFSPYPCTDWIEIRQDLEEQNGERLCGQGFGPDAFHYTIEDPLQLNGPTIPVLFRSFNISYFNSKHSCNRAGARLCYKLKDPMCVLNSRIQQIQQTDFPHH